MTAAGARTTAADIRGLRPGARPAAAPADPARGVIFCGCDLRRRYDLDNRSATVGTQPATPDPRGAEQSVEQRSAR
ncbi:hypothetical protein GCM10027174_22300 [Salinifilum aidingensis]